MYDGTIRDCLPPIPASAPLRIRVPVGAWDTHAHVIGSAPDYPLVPGRHFNPPPASASDFLSMLSRIGITYGVLVQGSVHGTDNQLLLEALRTYPHRLKGVAVIDEATSDREIAELKAAGTTGIRLLDIVGGGVGLASLERLADRCAEVGWHIQLGIKGEVYPSIVERVVRLPVPVVLDHMGWFPVRHGLQGPEFKAIMAIVRNAQCFVKLSGAFRLSAGGPPYADTFAFARALMEAAPDRMVWGSDWPHVGLYQPEARPDVGGLLDWLADTLPNPEDQRRVLVENPAALYGLPTMVPAE